MAILIKNPVTTCAKVSTANLTQISCARGDTIWPCPPPPRGLLSDSRAAEQTQRSSSFPRPIRSHAHRCTCLMCEHGGEQSGLVTLTFDLLNLKVVSKSRVMWATSLPILVFLGLSVLDLVPMYATDRQTSDRRHKTASMRCPAY